MSAIRFPARRGDRMSYISGLTDLLELKKEFPDMQMVLHSDQGSVYASKGLQRTAADVQRSSLHVTRRYADGQCSNGSNQRLDKG